MARMFSTSDPSLPPYKSLIVQGDYHPSAPIHMCLSVPTGAKALLLSSARQALIRSLREYNDEWLLTDSGTGNTCQSSSNVDIFYPPTPNHLVVLLSAFRTHEASNPVPLDAKATLDSVPSLLVLHELSAYFLPIDENKPYTIASYLQLVSHALALASFLSPKSQTPMRFTLFDSQLDKLKLPVLRTPPVPVFGGEENGDETPRPESVAFVAHKYFEWPTQKLILHLMEMGYAAVRSHYTSKAVISNRILYGGGQKFQNGHTAAVRNLLSHLPGEDMGLALPEISEHRIASALGH